MTRFVLGSLAVMIPSCGQVARNSEVDIEKFVEEVRASRGGAKLVCDEEEHDFGTVWAGAKLCHTFKFKNIGNETAHVKFIGSSPIWNAHFDIDPDKEYPHEVCLDSRKHFGLFAKCFTVFLMPEPYEFRDRCPVCGFALDGIAHERRCGPTSPNP